MPKIGDMLYVIYGGTEIYEYMIEDITECADDGFCYWYEDDGKMLFFDTSEIGIDAFLTREEAEDEVKDFLDSMIWDGFEKYQEVNK